MTVTCLLCEKKDLKIEITPKEIARSKQEGMQFLGRDMIQHLMNSHNEVTNKFPLLVAQINGLLVSIYFEGSEEFEQEKQRVLDAVCEAIIPDGDEKEEEKDMEDAKQACELLDEIVSYIRPDVLSKEVQVKVDDLKEMIMSDDDEDLLEDEYDEEDEEEED